MVRSTGAAAVERFAGEHGWWGDRAGEPAGCLSGGWGWEPGIGTGHSLPPSAGSASRM